MDEIRIAELMTCLSVREDEMEINVRCVEEKPRTKKMKRNEQLIQKELLVRDKDGDTLLHLAIILMMEELSLQMIKLAESNKMVNVANDLRQTALHLAVITGQHVIVRALVVAGADILAVDTMGNMPLHLAAKNGELECFEQLVTPVTYPEVKNNTYEYIYQKIPQDFDTYNYDGLSFVHLASQNIMNGDRNHMKCFQIIKKMITMRGVEVAYQKDRKHGFNMIDYSISSTDTTFKIFAFKYWDTTRRRLPRCYEHCNMDRMDDDGERDECECRVEEDIEKYNRYVYEGLITPTYS